MLWLGGGCSKSNAAAWALKDDEEVERLEKVMNGSTNQARVMLRLAHEAMKLTFSLSTSQPIVGAMLHANVLPRTVRTIAGLLEKLCGDEVAELKVCRPWKHLQVPTCDSLGCASLTQVDDLSRFKFEPKTLLFQLAVVTTRLAQQAGSPLAAAVADLPERDVTLRVLLVAAEGMEEHLLVDLPTQKAFVQFVGRVDRAIAAINQAETATAVDPATPAVAFDGEACNAAIEAEYATAMAKYVLVKGTALRREGKKKGKKQARGRKQFEFASHFQPLIASDFVSAKGRLPAIKRCSLGNVLPSLLLSAQSLTPGLPQQTAASDSKGPIGEPTLLHLCVL